MMPTDMGVTLPQYIDDRITSSPGIPARYGNACTNCALAKCKCIIRHAGECERCRRLDKECHPGKRVRRRYTRRPASSEITRVEEKLDSLVSLIKTGGQPKSLSHSQLEASQGFNSNNIIQRRESSLSTDNRTSISHKPQLNILDVMGVKISVVDAERNLTDYQTFKSKYFPFIYISPTTTTSQLRYDRPFLWLCVMAVSSKSTSQQDVLATKVRETVAQEIVLNSERNIDLLSGLLVFIAWAHYQFQSKPFLTVFTQLATSMLYELGLNNPVPQDTQTLPLAKEKCRKPITPRTMEERRAVLGCFMVTSVISLFFQKIDTLRWTSHMDECLQILDSRKECFNDEILVHQVQLQLIIQRKAQSIPILHHGRVEFDEHMTSYESASVETLLSQLQVLETRLINDQHIDETILLHLYNTKIENLLSPIYLHPSTHTTISQENNNIDLGIESLISWFDSFFTIPPASYIGFSFSIYTQLIRCLNILFRVTTQANSCTITQIDDPILILDRLIHNLEKVEELAGLDNSGSKEKDAFSQTARMLRSLRPVWEMKLTLNVESVDETFFPNDMGEFLDSSSDWLLDLFLSSNP